MLRLAVLAALCTDITLCADDPPKKLTAEERKELETKWDDLMLEGGKAYRSGNHPEAARAFQAGLEIARKAYPNAEFPDGHANLAISLNNVALLLHVQGKPADAERLYREALAMTKRMFKGDHPDVAGSLNNLAALLREQGKLADAESLLREALEMYKRMFKGDHPAVAGSSNNLAAVLREQGKLADAELRFREALEMYQRMFKGDHSAVARSMNNLAAVLQGRAKLADAEALYRDALGMNKRLYKGDHPDVALSLNNLAASLRAQGKLTEAELLYRDALEMYKRMFKGDHPAVATTLNNIASLLWTQGKLAEAESLSRDTLEMFKRLFKGDHPDIARSVNNLAAILREQGKVSDAELLYREALDMTKRLFKGDHPAVAISMDELAGFYESQGKLADAEPLCKDALDMFKRLLKDRDHPDVAQSLNNLAGLYQSQGRLADAEPLYKDALDMRKRLFKTNHPDVAISLGNLATLFLDQRKPAAAEPLFRDALTMNRQVFQGDHHQVAASLNNLAAWFREQGKLADAELHFRDALAMHKRLFKGDHPNVARNLNNVAVLLQDQGNLADAELHFRDAMAMYKRLFKGDHPAMAFSLNNQAFLLQNQGKLSDAELVFRDALAMYRRLLETYAGLKGEGEALTLIASRPVTRGGFLSVAREAKSDVGTVYSEVWADKAAVARIYELRQQAGRVVTDPSTAKLLTELASVRRRRAELLFAPEVRDPATRKKREEDLKELDKRIAELDRDLRPLLPNIERAEKLAKATPTELQRVIPTEAAVVDLLSYTFFEFDKDKPGKAGEKRAERYLAFVVTKDKVAWIDLETADRIEGAVNLWRQAITSGKDIPAAVPAKVRELVWEKVRKELPANIKTVYIAPDQDLCRVPWGALPGDKPGTILLEDFAIATIPHAPFLLDKLWEQDKLKNPPSGSLVVGGVNFDAEATAGPLNRDLPIKPGTVAAWQALPGAAAEATGVESAAKKKGNVTTLKGEAATPAAVLAALPKAKYAHFATHGFFADPSFRSAFQLDEKDFQQSWRGERIGRAALSPLVMTGLVFAGANNPKTPGRGIVTGEALVDLDLSGLELAVLSACETGLGDVAGGEGTFGLQRAFHLAGTRDVVASLWKVPDAPTAALMAEFYRNLWTQNLSPRESLRQAQLTIYRNPGKIAELAAGFRAGFKEVKSDEIEIKPTADGKAHPKQWAAFTLSGIGR